MLLSDLVQTAQDFIAAAPTTPTTPPATTPPATGSVNLSGINDFVVKQVLPIVLMLIGVGIIARGSRGQMSRVLTTSFISIIGLVFIAGAGSLWLFGDFFVNLIVKK